MYSRMGALESWWKLPFKQVRGGSKPGGLEPILITHLHSVGRGWRMRRQAASPYRHLIWLLRLPCLRQPRATSVQRRVIRIDS
jgi:hypothetical protein